MQRQIRGEVLFGDAVEKTLGGGEHVLRRAQADAIDQRIRGNSVSGFSSLCWNASSNRRALSEMNSP